MAPITAPSSTSPRKRTTASGERPAEAAAKSGLILKV